MQPSKVPIDVVLYIALNEELDFVEAELGSNFHASELENIAITPLFGQIHSDSQDRDFNILVISAGKMGNTRAANVVSAIIERYRPQNVVVLGIAGSASKDLEPGDVFIPDSVNEYLANSAGIGKNRWTLQTSGNHFPIDPRLLDRFRNFSRTRKEYFERWRRITAENSSELINGEIRLSLLEAGIALKIEGKLLAGDDRVLASGPTVGKGNAFINWLKNQVDRKVAAIEMESAGAFDASLIRTPAPRAVAIRGISDFADERKEKLEDAAKQAFRHLAIKNAISLFLIAVQAGLFKDETDQVVRKTGPPGNTHTSTAPDSSSDVSLLLPYFAHSYPLEANFTGREAERQKLSKWLNDDSYPICELVAIGGMGKSALAWVWIIDDVLKTYTARISSVHRDSQEFEVEGLIWWSFYDAKSSFPDFVNQALMYISGQEIDEERLPTTYDRCEELLRRLQTKHILLILDGFERQLQAYSGLGAPYDHENINKSTRDLRACVDPAAARLLRAIASGHTRAKVLVISRLMVWDLEDESGYPLSGVLKQELSHLRREDAIAFFREMGVTKGTSTQIANACAAYGNHPLSLRLLAGLIAHDAERPGDIRLAPKYAANTKLIHHRNHILELSYNILSQKEQILLSRIAAFRNAIEYKALKIWNNFGSKSTFDSALNNLQSRGFLQRETQGTRYDLHPVVRQYAYDRLSDKIGIHARVRKYFAKFPAPEIAKSVDDLAPVIELYHHTVSAGLHAEALELYYDRLHSPLYHQIGDFKSCIKLLRALSPERKDLEKRVGAGWRDLRNLLAYLYTLTGQPRRAVPLFTFRHKWRASPSGNRKLSELHGKKAEAYMQLGEFKNAHDEFEIAMSGFSIDEGNYLRMAHFYLYTGDVKSAEKQMKKLTGYHHEITKEMQQAENRDYFADITQLDVDYWYAVDWAEYELFKPNSIAAVTRARKAYALFNQRDDPTEASVIRNEWLIGATVLLQIRRKPTYNPKDLHDAESHLTEALRRSRRSNFIELEPQILLALAECAFLNHDIRISKTFAEEALLIANRSEYRLIQAQLHNWLAQLALQTDDAATARQHAQIALERAWCDGPDYYYKAAYENAEVFLRSSDKV